LAGKVNCFWNQLIVATVEWSITGRAVGRGCGDPEKPSRLKGNVQRKWKRPGNKDITIKKHRSTGVVAELNRDV
jgi:hypothetical protein